jgi:hypothetical protein
MTDVVILVPRRADHGIRDDLWRFARAWWAREFPDWPIIEGHHDDGPFNRSAAVNRAAELAGAWNVAVIIDADVLPTPSAIRGAVAVARQNIPACGFHLRRHLSKQGTVRVMRGDRASWERWVKQDHKDSVSGAYVLSRSLWDQVGGFDESFVGWGWEDVAFKLATETIAGADMVRTAGALWHLWHPVTPERDESRPEFIANRERARLYRAAKGNRVAMLELLDGTRTVPAVRPTVRTSGIPRILHRTVPTETTAEVEGFWRAACLMHPEWEHRTWRDPLDPADFPETSPVWDRCTSGAQLAGLVRLEALWHHGGVYIDSDVEMYRPLDPLCGVAGFAGWEDARVVPDAVLGFTPQHPAVAEMIDLAYAAVRDGHGAWKSGPGVTTTVLPGRRDVLLLPPGSMYPYHYTERHRRGEDHRSKQPWALMAHHWHHSWKGR